jgi:hypothetical protein
MALPFLCAFLPVIVESTTHLGLKVGEIWKSQNEKSPSFGERGFRAGMVNLESRAPVK